MLIRTDYQVIACTAWQDLAAWREGTSSYIDSDT